MGEEETGRARAGSAVSYQASIPAGERPLSGDSTELSEEQLRTSYRRLARLCDISQRLFSEDEPEAIFQRILEAVSELLDVQRALVATVEGGKLVPRAVHGFEAEVAWDRLGISRTITDRVLEQGEALLSLDAQIEPGLAEAKSVQLGKLRSVLCCPLGSPRAPAGLIYVDNSRYGSAFGREDLRFVHALAHYARLALHAAAALASERDLSRARYDTITRAYGPGHDVVGGSRAMQDVLARAVRVSQTQAPVLLVGETGTGKEVVARAIHHESDRRDRPFVPVNMGTLGRETAVSALFGHERGAFTGATSNAVGLFQQASGGVLFLDEVSATPLDVQVMLLRALQDQRVRPMGARQEVAVDVRVVAASNVPLEAEVAAGRFREDLLYRLNVVTIEIPALRERPEDIDPLLDHFLGKFAPGKRIAPAARSALCAHTWPGNVRALRNVVESLCILAPGDEIGVDDLPVAIRGGARSESAVAGEAESLGAAVDRTKRQMYERALRITEGHRGQAIELLGVSRATFYQDAKRFGLIDVGGEKD